MAVLWLKEEVTDVEPAKRYAGDSEQGKVGTSVGFGRTGEGDDLVRTVDRDKRGMDNVIDSTAGNVLVSDFDGPNDNPQSLEGLIDGGDSGGGVFIQDGAGWELAGVHSTATGTPFPPPPPPTNDSTPQYGDNQYSGRVAAQSDFIDRGIAQSFVNAGDRLPEPWEIPGKEYSDRFDKDMFNVLDPEQNLAWDGFGNVVDTYDYEFIDGQVDALANTDDALFNDVVADNAYLLFSTTSDPNIYYEFPDILVGDIWATPPEINANGVADVDGLEVWGPEGKDDADAFSLEGDPNDVAVYVYDEDTTITVPYLTTFQIAEAIGRPDLGDSLTLDALMLFDWTPDQSFFDEGSDRILFSIDPIDIFDGGEIWAWDSKNTFANFLVHGGHVWDTAFDVMGTYGTASEDVNALEAVAATSPSTILLFSLGGVALGWRKRARRAV